MKSRKYHLCSKVFLVALVVGVGAGMHTESARGRATALQNSVRLFCEASEQAVVILYQAHEQGMPIARNKLPPAGTKEGGAAIWVSFVLEQPRGLEPQQVKQRWLHACLKGAARLKVERSLIDMGAQGT